MCFGHKRLSLYDIYKWDSNINTVSASIEILYIFYIYSQFGTIVMSTKKKMAPSQFIDWQWSIVIQHFQCWFPWSIIYHQTGTTMLFNYYYIITSERCITCCSQLRSSNDCPTGLCFRLCKKRVWKPIISNLKYSFYFFLFSLALHPLFGPWPTSGKLSVSLRFSRS
jgi:hypothetical protein